jgi:hypothetical protein
MSACECKRDSAQPSRKWRRFAQCFVMLREGASENDRLQLNIEQ